MITDLKQIPVSSYNNSLIKRLLDLVLSTTLFIAFLPLFLITAVLIVISSGSPIFFIQKRIGKNGKIFKIFKFRTMKKGAERERLRYLHLNEVDGPVFKIRDDPRYTKFGKILARLGLDELPQIVNVIKGEMSLVGPRPLPIYEAKKLSKLDQQRNLVKPGITSSWVIMGGHNLKFSKWMRLDLEYIRNALLKTDLVIFGKSLFFFLKIVKGVIFPHFR